MSPPVPEETRPAGRPAWAELLRDVCGLGGLVMIAFGLYHVFPPMALIVPGILMFWLAVRDGL